VEATYPGDIEAISQEEVMQAWRWPREPHVGAGPDTVVRIDPFILAASGDCTGNGFSKARWEIS
jgi:hypothetical protein